MSYSILYRAMGIKMSDGTVVPMIESGDNNVYDYNGKRYRRWDNCWAMLRDKLSYTPEEIGERVDEVINDHIKSNEGKKHYGDDGIITADEVRQQFGYFTGITISGRNSMTSTAFKNFFLKCYTQSVDFDFLNRHYISVKVVYYVKGEDGKAELQTSYVESEKQLLEEFDKARKVYHDYAYITFDSVGEDAYNEIRTKRPKTTPKEKTKGFVVKANGNYVYKMSSRRTWKCWDIKDAHIYSDRASANKVAERLNTHYLNVTASVIDVVKIDGQWVSKIA